MSNSEFGFISLQGEGMCLTGQKRLDVDSKLQQITLLQSENSFSKAQTGDKFAFVGKRRLTDDDAPEIWLLSLGRSSKVAISLKRGRGRHVASVSEW